MMRLASSRVACRKTCILPPPERWTQGAEHHIRLPDPIGELGFVLFVRDGFLRQELAFGESVGAQKTIERGGRKTSLIMLASER
jgi:hypothetical protein